MKIKELKVELLETLGIFLSIKTKAIISQLEKVNFKATIIMNIKVKATEKHYQLKNIFIKLKYT